MYTPATADIYKYRGPDGRLIISNTPPPPTAQVERKSAETIRSSTPNPTETAPSPSAQTANVPVQQTAKPEKKAMSVREKRAKEAAKRAQWQHHFDAAMRKYSSLLSMDAKVEANRFRSRLLRRDTENNTDKGSTAIYDCEKKYWDNSRLLACLVAHYGG